jgi:hypothetical protein
MKYCDGGDEIAHGFSAKDVDQYDERETDKKLDGIAGPHTCETFDGLCRGICDECPNLGKIKSPIVLGREFQEAVPTTVGWDADGTAKEVSVDHRPPCPKPFKWGGNRPGVYMDWYNKEDKEWQDLVILEHNFYIYERINDQKGDGESIVFVLELPFDGVREFTVPLSQIQSPIKMREALAFEGLSTSTSHWPFVAEYISKSVVELQLRRKAIQVNRQFGWTDDKKSFVIGDRIYRAGQAEPNHNYPIKSTKHLFKAMEETGDLEEWKYMANTYGGKGMELRQMMVCMGFGSPLMDMIDNVACCGFHIYSKGSGLGKTSCLDAAISVWGEPERLRLKKDDTINGVMKRTSLYKNILACLDEMTNPTGEVLSEMVYKLSSGQEKIRLNKDSAEMPVGGPWSLISITTANTSMLERIAMDKQDPNAEAQRIMECFFDRVPRPDVDEDRFNKALVGNHGVAGPIFIQYILDNYDEVKAALHKYRNAIIKRFNLTTENRFWSAGLACILLGGEIAKRLGLLDYDMEAIAKYMGTVVSKNQDNVSDQSQSVEELLGKYLSEVHGGVLTITSGQSNTLFREILPHKLMRALVGRYETETKKLSLSHGAFSQWLSANQAGAKETITQILNTMDARIVEKCTLTKGVAGMASVRTKAIVFNNYDYDDDDEDIH